MAHYNEEQAELHKTIWAIANDLRGAVDGWEFKAYVLGTIFYRYLSENIIDYINGIQARAGVVDFNYAEMNNADAMGAKNQIVAEKGYFILPSQLFCNVCKTASSNLNLNETLNNIFRFIEESAVGTASEENVKGLFSEFVVDSSKLGANVIERNKLIAKVLLKVQDMQLGRKVDEMACDPFGDAYEYLMQMYASNAGKSGGEFFTPQAVSELLVKLATYNNPKIRKVYDPACGSGSLLLKFARMEGKDKKLQYYGQEINPATYNLCRSNMFLHDINYDHFHIALGDTLLKPQWMEEVPFDAIVSNPPYSIPWEGKDNPLLMNDERYAPAGVLAPTSKSDLAFTMHMLYYLSESGTAAIVEFPGVLYRTGVEQTIRQYMIENNYVDTIIQLPQNLFFGVGIATCIIVLKKCKQDNGVLFIDASKMFEKVGNKNYLREEDQEKIMEVYKERKDVQYISKWVENGDIVKNESNLSVSSYVEHEDTREKIDIKMVNSDIARIVAEEQELREAVDKIVEELGEEEL